MTPVVLSTLFDHMAAEHRPAEPEMGTIQDLLELKSMTAHA
jgi:hypothetical protein